MPRLLCLTEPGDIDFKLDCLKLREDGFQVKILSCKLRPIAPFHFILFTLWYGIQTFLELKDVWYDGMIVNNDLTIPFGLLYGRLAGLSPTLYIYPRGYLRWAFTVLFLRYFTTAVDH